jgi:transposase, IS5 family
MSRNWQHNAVGLEDEKPREVHLRFVPIFHVPFIRSALAYPTVRKNVTAALIDQKPKTVFVDRGYRGIAVDGVTIWRSGQKRGVTPAIIRAIYRRSAVEPAIGHTKNEGKLCSHLLKDSPGDALNPVLCGAGHNLKMVLRATKIFYVWMLCLAIAEPRQQQSPYPEFRRFAAL